jgi:hypothetical protein
MSCSPEPGLLGRSNLLMRSGLRNFQQIPIRIIMTTTRMTMKARNTVFGSVVAMAVLYFCIFFMQMPATTSEC